MIAENSAFSSKESLKLSITQSYYTEYFARQKKLPKLDKIIKEIDKPRKSLSRGDMILKAMVKKKVCNNL